MISLSIIVPIYRAEPYLDRCVQSLLHQKLSPAEYEIILVDDGSDDGSPALCDQYAQRYQQVRVIHQENKGLSEARNTGIQEAKGLYITFVDADDYVETNSYDIVLRQAYAHHLDALQFGVQIVRDDKISPIGTPVKDDLVYTGTQFLDTYLSVQCYAVRYLIRRSLLMENAILFYKGIYYEDVEWLPRMLYAAQRVMRSDCIVYNYVIRHNSITHPTTKEKWNHLIQDNLLVLSRYVDLIEKMSTSTWLQAMSASIITSILTIVAKQFYAERHNYIKQIQSIYSYPLRSKRNFPLAERIKVKIVRFSPELYCLIRHCL